MKFSVLVIASALALAGCQTSPLQDHVWVRTDGVQMSTNPALRLQGERDVTACTADVQRAAVGQPPVYYQGIGGSIAAGLIVDQRSRAFVDVMKGCMADRGYVLVPQDQAAARAAELRAIAG